MLCENPARHTGLTTLFQGMVEAALRRRPDVNWLVFAGPEQPWPIDDARVDVVRDFPANDRLFARLGADHFAVGPRAAAGGAAALITTGFMPWRAPLPVAMQVVTLHHAVGRFSGGFWRRAYRAAALRRGLRRAALVIANSGYTADCLRRAQPGLDARLCVSPEGVDPRTFNVRAEPGEAEALAREFGIKPGAVLWVSNFYAYKRAEDLIAAYARLPAEMRAAHPLVMAGGDWRGGEGAARAAARRHGVDAVFPGRLNDRWLPALYRHAAVHALASTEETFGRTVLEAMACGCPCVLNDIPAFREVGADAVGLVNFSRPDAAAAALEEVLGDAELAARRREAGRKRAAEFSFDRLAGERIAAIEAVVSRQ